MSKVEHETVELACKLCRGKTQAHLYEIFLRRSRCIHCSAEIEFDHETVWRFHRAVDEIKNRKHAAENARQTLNMAQQNLQEAESGFAQAEAALVGKAAFLLHR